MTELIHKQHHHWGITEHGICQRVHAETIVDEYLYEFSTVEEIIVSLVGEKTFCDLILDGGGWLMTDSQSVQRQAHHIEVFAFHPDQRRLLLYTLRCEKTTQ